MSFIVTVKTSNRGNNPQRKADDALLDQCESHMSNVVLQNIRAKSPMSMSIMFVRREGQKIGNKLSRAEQSNPPADMQLELDAAWNKQE